MSFSSDVKEELSKISNLPNKEEVKAELIGYLLTSNIDIQKQTVKYSTESQYNINRFGKLLSNLGYIDYKIEIQGKVYSITVKQLEMDEINYKENKNGNSEIVQWRRNADFGLWCISGNARGVRTLCGRCHCSGVSLYRYGTSLSQ